MENVQIVNGLQTSYSVFDVLRNLSPDHPAFNRSIKVSILLAVDDEVRDQIIVATNSQNKVDDASLWATDGVQRNIEEYFYRHGWFYDRRKNYYKNEGKRRDRIKGIGWLGQAVMSMGLSKPDQARARPTSLLKTSAGYSQVFSADIPLEVYLWIANAQSHVSNFLVSAADSRVEQNNLQFHLATLAVRRLLGHQARHPRQLARLVTEGRSLDEIDLQEILDELRRHVQTLTGDSGQSLDKLAKGQELVKVMLSN